MFPIIVLVDISEQVEMEIFQMKLKYKLTNAMKELTKREILVEQLLSEFSFE